MYELHNACSKLEMSYAVSCDGDFNNYGRLHVPQKYFSEVIAELP